MEGSYNRNFIALTSNVNEYCLILTANWEVENEQNSGLIYIFGDAIVKNIILYLQNVFFFQFHLVYEAIAVCLYLHMGITF